MTLLVVGRKPSPSIDRQHEAARITIFVSRHTNGEAPKREGLAFAICKLARMIGLSILSGQDTPMERVELKVNRERKYKYCRIVPIE
jgi:hypothetical protein